MSEVASPVYERPVYRRAITFCVLPRDLAWLQDDLRRLVADGAGDVRVVVDRRPEGSADRRRRLHRAGDVPGGVERRTGERRGSDPSAASLTDLGVHLPWRIRRHADRIACVRQMLPVHPRDAAHEADVLLAAAATGDPRARAALRLRYHQEALGYLRTDAHLRRRRATDAVDAVFDELFAQPPVRAFSRELSQACERVLARG